VLQSNFWEEDVKVILAIPLGTYYDEEPAWHADAKGFFQ
jgi:hypothetical protein